MNKIIVCLITVLGLTASASAERWLTVYTTLSAGGNLLVASDVGGPGSGDREVRLTGSASGSTLDGFHEGYYSIFDSSSDADAVGVYGGDVLRLYNDGTTNITIVNHSSATGVDSTNWIKTYSGRDVILQPGEWLKLVADISNYDYGIGAYHYYGWAQVVDHSVYGAKTATQPSRSVGTAWQPNIARATMVVVSLSATCSLTLTGGAAGHIDVLVGSTSSPTTVVGSVPCANTGAVVVGVNSTVTTGGAVSYIVRPGDYVKVTTTNTTGTPSYTLAVTEEPL